MNNEQPQEILKFDEFDFAVTVRTKNTSYPFINVEMPFAKVYVNCKTDTDKETIKEVIEVYHDWIKDKINKIKNTETYGPRQYVTGEDHYLLGSRYRLNLIESTLQSPRIEIKGKFLEMYVRPNTSLKRKERIMHNFYRENLRSELSLLVPKWSFTMDIQPPKEVLIIKKRRRWGSCFLKKRHICLNLNLARYSPHFLEYVFVNQMVYLLARRHGKWFRSYMDAYLPKWRSLAEQLHEESLPFWFVEERDKKRCSKKST